MMKHIITRSGDVISRCLLWESAISLVTFPSETNRQLLWGCCVGVLRGFPPDFIWMTQFLRWSAKHSYRSLTAVERDEGRVMRGLDERLVRERKKWLDFERQRQVRDEQSRREIRERGKVLFHHHPEAEGGDKECNWNWGWVTMRSCSRIFSNFSSILLHFPCEIVDATLPFGTMQNVFAIQ